MASADTVAPLLDQPQSQAPHDGKVPVPAAAVVEGLVDWRFGSPMMSYDDSLADKIDRLGELIGEQIRELSEMDGAPDTPYLLCSSYLPKILIDVPARAERLLNRVAQVGGRRPMGLVQTYECASWGHVWQCLARHGTSRSLTITIVDSCLHGLTHFASHPTVGKSGFGITSVQLRLPDHDSAASIEVAGPYPDSGFKEFIRAIRDRSARSSSTRVMVPYFREDLGAIATRIVGPERTTRNRNAEHGHCFGSDPWIALAADLAEGTVSPGDIVTLGTLAYNGYFAVADVVAPELVRVRHRRWP
jgi:hypothetical protein